MNINNWTSLKELTSIIGISQMLPGPVAANILSFIGYKEFGILGVIVCVLGFVTIPFLIVTLAYFLIFKKFKESKLLKHILVTIRPILIALIISTFISFLHQSIDSTISIIIAITSVYFLFIKKLNPMFVIIISGALGFILSNIL
jgi:chromate transporter